MSSGIDLKHIAMVFFGENIFYVLHDVDMFAMVMCLDWFGQSDCIDFFIAIDSCNFFYYIFKHIEVSRSASNGKTNGVFLNVASEVLKNILSMMVWTCLACCVFYQC